MGEAYGGGLLGRAEQFFDAVPGGMRGPQAPLVRMAVGGLIGYGLVTVTASYNPLMYFSDGTPKPWRFSQEGANAGAENSALVPYWAVPLTTSVVSGLFI
jgi:hypothetical protein